MLLYYIWLLCVVEKVFTIYILQKEQNLINANVGVSPLRSDHLLNLIRVKEHKDDLLNMALKGVLILRQRYRPSST